MDETERVVVITGGSRGIGRAVALRFALEKAMICILHYDPDESAARETLEMIQSKGCLGEGHRVDVSLYANAKGVFEDILSRHQRVDVLVNNAGITRDNLFMRMSEEEWDTVIRVNLKGVFNCTHAIIRSMIKQRGGRVVNISSVVGQIGNPGQANYAASKAGIMGFTRSVAREVAARGVTVNAVAPGFIDTEMTASLGEKVKEALLQQIPMGRVGSPEDVAGAVYWLCSQEAAYITGQTVHVNGGMFM